VTILACSQNPTFDPPSRNALAATIAEHRARLAALDTLVREARDVVTCPDASLDTALRERDRTIWELEQLADLHPDSDPR